MPKRCAPKGENHTARIESNCQARNSDFSQSLQGEDVGHGVNGKFKTLGDLADSVADFDAVEVGTDDSPCDDGKCELGDKMEISENARCVVPGTLYLVSVPIGNVGDWSPRARAVVSQVDLVACEEVQVTRRLFQYCGLKARLVSYRESGRETSGERLLRELLNDKSLAYVSGAGTPAISDPGRDLVERCHKNGIPVRVVPGPSALTAAIACAGLPCRRFVFEGFVPRQDGERRRYLQSLEREERTMVFYEAPHRLAETLVAMLDVWGERRVFLGRELTKRFEECRLVWLSDLVELCATRGVKGECVLVVEGYVPDPEAQEAESQAWLSDDLQFFDDCGLDNKACVEILCHYRGLTRNEAKRLIIKHR